MMEGASSHPGLPSESVVDPASDERAPTFRLSYLDDCHAP
jgi:hypothetical protein